MALTIERPGAVEAGCWLLAACLIAAGIAWPSVSSLPARHVAESDAAEVLHRIARAERSVVDAQLHYQPIEPLRGAAALDLPGYEAPPGAARFAVYAVPGDDGSLAVRVFAQPDAVRDGTAAPVLVRQELPAPAKPAAAPAPRLSASSVP